MDHIVAYGFRLMARDIQRLPEDVLEKLLQRMAEENRLTDATALRSLTRQRTSVTWTGATTLRRAVFSEIPRRCPNLRELRVQWCKQVGNRTIRDLLHCCRSLQVLRLDGCQRISDAAFASQPFDIMYGLMELVEIGLSQCPQITDETLHILIKKCPKLVVLDISRNRRITDPPIRDLLDSCRSLVRLNVEYCSRLTAETLIPLAAARKGCETNAASAAAPEGVSDLMVPSHVDHLALREFYWGGIATSHAHLGSFVLLAPRLQVLDLRWCPGVTDSALKALYFPETDAGQRVSACRLVDLHTLCLRGCSEITNCSLALIRGCTKLRKVDLSWCIKLCPREILASLEGQHDLEYLNISFCCSLEKAHAPGSPQLFLPVSRAGHAEAPAYLRGNQQLLRCCSEGSFNHALWDDAAERPSPLADSLGEGLLREFQPALRAESTPQRHLISSSSLPNWTPRVDGPTSPSGGGSVRGSSPPVSAGSSPRPWALSAYNAQSAPQVATGASVPNACSPKQIPPPSDWPLLAEAVHCERICGKRARQIGQRECNAASSISALNDDASPDICTSPPFLPSLPKMPRRFRMGRTGPTDREWWRFYADNPIYQPVSHLTVATSTVGTSAVATQLDPSFPKDACADRSCSFSYTDTQRSDCVADDSRLFPLLTEAAFEVPAGLESPAQRLHDPCERFLSHVSETLKRFKLDGLEELLTPACLRQFANCRSLASLSIRLPRCRLLNEEQMDLHRACLTERASPPLSPVAASPLQLHDLTLLGKSLTLQKLRIDLSNLTQEQQNAYLDYSLPSFTCLVKLALKLTCGDLRCYSTAALPDAEPASSMGDILQRILAFRDGRHGQKLRVLQLFNCTFLKRSLTKAAETPNGPNKTFLNERLSRVRSFLVADCLDLEDEDVLKLCRALPGLHQMFLLNCPKLTERAYSHVVQHCHVIQTIHIIGSRFRKRTDRALL